MTTTPDMFLAGLKMIAALGVVLAVMLGLLWLSRKFSGFRPGVAGHRQIQVLESCYMGAKKTISLVRVPGKVLVVGVSGDRINLLDAIDPELVETAPACGQAETFAPLLSRRLKELGRGFKGKDPS